MKRHPCLHCGLALNTFAVLRRHADTHATPSFDHNTYSLAPPAVVPSSNHAMITKYVCEKCGRWDSLQHDVRYVCSGCSSSGGSGNGSGSGSGSSHSQSSKVIATSICKKCRWSFSTRKDIFRHTGNACTDVKEPPLPKCEENTTPHQLVTA